MSKRDLGLIRLRELPRVECLQAEAARCPEHKPHAVEAFLAITTVATAMHAHLDDGFAEHGLSRGRLIVLMLLRHAKGGTLTPAELAHGASVTTATVTGLLDGLETQGFVKRSHREDDRRSIRVELTPLARTKLDRFLPGHWSSVAGFMGRLSQAEQTQLTRLLVKLIDPPRESEVLPATPRRSAARANGRAKRV